MGSNSQNDQFYKSDVDLGPMTLVLKLDLDMVKMSHYTKNEVSMSGHSKVIACTDTQTDRQTHRQYENITFSHTRAVITFFGNVSFKFEEIRKIHCSISLVRVKIPKVQMENKPNRGKTQLVTKVAGIGRNGP